MNFSSLVFCLLMLALSPLALAQTPSSAAGKTLMARGTVEAEADQASRLLKRRSPIYTADLVSTGRQSATQLRMSDGGLLSLQADSELSIENYQFNQGDEQSSVAMSLIKGGLRTVTGALKADGNNYRLNTPVASIGVRGTHYEAELVESDLYLACWEGQIEIDVTVPNAAKTFYLGPRQDYRFAVVRKNGEVEFFIQGPSAFSEGHAAELATTADIEAEPKFSINADLNPTEQAQVSASLLAANYTDLSGDDLYDNDQLIAQLLPSDIVQRNGQANFDLLAQSSFSSTESALTNINMNMQINFDAARVPTGSFSATDTGGEWFAVFNGFIDQQSLQLEINFASHGNQLAGGEIEAVLLNDASGIFGQLDLFELDNAAVQLGGSYLLVEQNP